MKFIFSMRVKFMLIRIDQCSGWKLRMFFSDENALLLIHGSVLLKSVGPRQRAIVVASSVKAATYRCLLCLLWYIEPSSEYVVLTDTFQHFGLRCMKIPFRAQQYFLDKNFLVVEIIHGPVHTWRTKVILHNCIWSFLWTAVFKILHSLILREEK